jgi:hypothetical protein
MQAAPPAGPCTAARRLLLVGLAALLLKILLALFTFGSTDVLIFEADLAAAGQDGGVTLYRDGIRTPWCGEPLRPCPPFIHPPFMVHALQGWALLSLASGLPFRFWLRFTCALADCGSLVLLVRLLIHRRRDPRALPALTLFAASPIAILVSGFHGNTDPIMIFFLLLSIYLIDGQRSSWLAGTALGMAANFKLVPVLLAPAALLSLGGTRRRIQFCVGATAIFLVGSLPLLAVAPALTLTSILGYSSQAGSWGLSLLALAIRESTGLTWVADMQVRHGKIFSLCLLLGALLWLRSRSRASAVFLHAGLLMFLFVSSTPGFGVQYLVWLVPWVVELGTLPTAVFYLTGTAFAFAYYRSAATGPFPWYAANTLAHPPWNGTVLAFGLICWVTVCSITLIYVHRVLASGPRPSGLE